MKVLSTLLPLLALSESDEIGEKKLSETMKMVYDQVTTTLDFQTFTNCTVYFFINSKNSRIVKTETLNFSTIFIGISATHFSEYSKNGFEKGFAKKITL